jgi:hypothetical protein
MSYDQCQMPMLRANPPTPSLWASTNVYLQNSVQAISWSWPNAHKHEILDECIVGINIFTWTNRNDQPIKASQISLLALLESIISSAYL